MQVYVPKIKISKYFKTKYQGAYIPPSLAKELQSEEFQKKGVNFANQKQDESLIESTQRRVDSQSFMSASSLPRIHSMK
jgi:hypothetical protein